MNPPVISLDAASFAKLVAQKGEEEIWLVDFFSPRCGPCQQLAPEWTRLAKVNNSENVSGVTAVIPSRKRWMTKKKH